MGSCRFLFSLHDSVSAKQEGNAPQTGKSYDGIDQSAEQSTGAAKQPGNQVKLENTHQAPVQTANDRKYQSDRIHKLYLHFKFGCH